MWLKKLKIAIVLKDTDAIDTLMDAIPELENPKEVEEAIYLLKEASNLVITLKDDTFKSMNQMKKNIDFLKSTQNKPSSTLNITS